MPQRETSVNAATPGCPVAEEVQSCVGEAVTSATLRSQSLGAPLGTTAAEGVLVVQIRAPLTVQVPQPDNPGALAWKACPSAPRQCYFKVKASAEGMDIKRGSCSESRSPSGLCNYEAPLE